MASPYINKCMTILTTDKCLYEGILVQVNPLDKTVTLRNVQTLKTLDHPSVNSPILPQKSFKSSEIDQIKFNESYQEPSKAEGNPTKDTTKQFTIVPSNASNPSPQAANTYPGFKAAPPQGKKVISYSTSSQKLTLRDSSEAPQAEVRGEYDFDEQNKKFIKPQGGTGSESLNPVYDPYRSFFDSINCQNVPFNFHDDRRKNIMTFGQAYLRKPANRRN